MPAQLNDELSFPSPDEADEFGIIAWGGDLRLERLVLAYHQGIFPWPHEGLPLLWFFPDPRFVLKPQEIRINNSLLKAIKQSSLEIVADRDFASVIKACARTLRKEEAGTWITDELIEAFTKFHKAGYAHSVEAYQNGELVGGLYGVNIGRMFFGESMFFKAPNASKICFTTLAAHLHLWNYSLIDCQMPTENLEKFGAKTMPKADFLKEITANQSHPTALGPWEFYLTPKMALELLANTVASNV
jgi:leucyl/phenylalanyl-tRNA--protein transferase